MISSLGSLEKAFKIFHKCSWNHFYSDRKGILWLCSFLKYLFESPKSGEIVLAQVNSRNMTLPLSCRHPPVMTGIDCVCEGNSFDWTISCDKFVLGFKEINLLQTFFLLSRQILTLLLLFQGSTRQYLLSAFI